MVECRNSLKSTKVRLPEAKRVEFAKGCDRNVSALDCSRTGSGSAIPNKKFSERSGRERTLNKSKVFGFSTLLTVVEETEPKNDRNPVPTRHSLRHAYTRSCALVGCRLVIPVLLSVVALAPSSFLQIA